jgi:hypothetical protein
MDHEKTSFERIAQLATGITGILVAVGGLFAAVSGLFKSIETFAGLAECSWQLQPSRFWYSAFG